MREYTHGARFLKNESEIMAKMVKITSYFTRSSEPDECNNIELLPEGDNLLLWESVRMGQHGSDNEMSTHRIATMSSLKL